jgi:hypothetical protein
MKNLLLPFLISFLLLQSVDAQINKNPAGDKTTADGVVLSFITYNHYGNNLYLDNFSIGTRYSEDVAALSITNIPADTSYLPGSGTYTISPKALIMNVGKFNTTPSMSR